MTIAGRRCAICHGHISGVLHGEFCPECGCPVHKQCMRTNLAPPRMGMCERCSAPVELALLETRSRRRAEVSLQQAFGQQDLIRGFLLLLGSVAFSFLCYWSFRFCGLVVPAGMIVVGVWSIVRGIVRLTGRDPDAAKAPSSDGEGE